MSQTINHAGKTIEIDDAGNLTRLEAFGNVVQPQEDGGFEITQADGSKISVSADGAVKILNTPKSIGVKDMSKISSYSISKEADGSTRHSIKFLNGGFADAVVASNGKFTYFSGEKIMTSIGKESDMLIDQDGE